jgi:hypothetical protein
METQQLYGKKEVSTKQIGEELLEINGKKRRFNITIIHMQTIQFNTQ